MEARRQDFDYLRRFVDVDKSFSEAQVAEFNTLMDDLETRADTMSEAEFIMSVSAAGAIPENGHTGVSISRTLSRLNSLPVRFVWFADGLHIVRAHAQDEYVSASDPTNYTNTIEGFFSIFKKGMRGIYQHCGQQYLHRYLAEFDFRYSNRSGRGTEDRERADIALKGIAGKRLTYRRIGEALAA